MAGKFEKLWDRGTRFYDAANIIMWLIGLATTSGAVTTIALLWQQLPWYEAAVYGAVLSAALVMLVVGVDHLWRVHTISKKIAVIQLRAVHVQVDEDGKKLMLILMAWIASRTLRPIWFKVERLHCHVDKTTHDPAPPMKPMEIQPDSPGGIPIPPISGLNATKHQFFGRLELEVSYGKAEGRLSKRYSTNGQFVVLVYPNQLGLPTAEIISAGATATYQ